MLCLQALDSARLCMSFAIKKGEEAKKQGGKEAGKEKERKLQTANLGRLELGPIVCFLGLTGDSSSGMCRLEMQEVDEAKEAKEAEDKATALC